MKRGLQGGEVRTLKSEEYKSKKKKKDHDGGFPPVRRGKTMKKRKFSLFQALGKGEMD